MTTLERSPGAEVRCRGLVHVYASEQGPMAALRDVDLTVQAGELLAIVGPSGSGKTTLMSLLGGLLSPTAGSIQIAGQDITRMDQSRLGQLRGTELSLLLQDPLANLLPYATVLENVSFASRGARRRGWPLRWEPAELLERLGLAELASRPIHRLSGGQQSQAAIASALATSPRLLLADEPTGELDPQSRDAIISALKEARELSGATLIIVTHDPAVATAMPRSLIIENGMIGSEGRGQHRFAVVSGTGSLQLPPEILKRHPAGTLLEVASDTTGAIILRPVDGPASEDGPS